MVRIRSKNNGLFSKRQRQAIDKSRIDGLKEEVKELEEIFGSSGYSSSHFELKYGLSKGKKDRHDKEYLDKAVAKSIDLFKSKDILRAIKLCPLEKRKELTKEIANLLLKELKVTSC